VVSELSGSTPARSPPPSSVPTPQTATLPFLFCYALSPPTTKTNLISWENNTNREMFTFDLNKIILHLKSLLE